MKTYFRTEEEHWVTSEVKGQKNKDRKERKNYENRINKKKETMEEHKKGSAQYLKWGTVLLL